MSHTSIEGESPENKCDCEPISSIPFLDTECSIKNGKIETALYRKPTDRNQYLLPTSCHPKQTTTSIPYSLATRIVRICSDKDTRDKELENLKILLKERQYNTDSVNRSIEKAKRVPRAQLLKPKNQEEKNRRPIFAVPYDPRLPFLQPIQAKHWRSMISRDAYLKEVFPEPPLTAFKRQRNLKDMLIRAKIPEKAKRNQERSIKGMKKCNKVYCNGCPFIKERKNFKVGPNKVWNINKQTTCNSHNIVYMIECDKEHCNQKYIGETKRTLRSRLAEHRGYVKNGHIDQATGAHFNMPGHNVTNLKIPVIEQVKFNSDLYRKEREEFFIRKFNTLNEGMNRKV